VFQYVDTQRSKHSRPPLKTRCFTLRCFVHFSVIKWSNGEDGHEEPVAINTDKRIQSIDYQYTLSHDVT